VHVNPACCADGRHVAPKDVAVAVAVAADAVRGGLREGGCNPFLLVSDENHQDKPLCQCRGGTPARDVAEIKRQRGRARRLAETLASLVILVPPLTL
jgi:hypothetical protein